MSGDGTRRGPGPLVIAAVFLGIFAVSYIAIEVVQRHRFSVLEGQAHAVVADFASAVRFDLDENNRLILRPATDTRGAKPILAPLHWEEVPERGTTWFIVAPIGSLGPRAPKRLQLVVFVDQLRSVILGPPRLQINLSDSTLIAIPDDLAVRFKAAGLSCGVYIAK